MAKAKNLFQRGTLLFKFATPKKTPTPGSSTKKDSPFHDFGVNDQEPSGSPPKNLTNSKLAQTPADYVRVNNQTDPKEIEIEMVMNDNENENKKNQIYH